MNPEDAARQLEYVVAPRLETDTCSHWERNAYREAFTEVCERGTPDDVLAFVSELGEEFEDGRRPTPDQARRRADALLTEGGRALTDGGDR